MPIWSLLFALALVALSQTPAPSKNCFKYDPKTLRMESAGASGWRVVTADGRAWLLDNEVDAKRALSIAAAFSVACRVPGPDGVNVQYLQGSGAMPLGPVEAELDCLPYASDKLRVTEGEGQFNLETDNRRLVAVSGKQDATALLKILEGHSKHCFVGRSNKRPNRHAYIFEYWR